MATGTSRRSACTMVFIVLLDFAEFLKLEIFSFALITTTIFRLALLRIGPVFNCFIGGCCNPKQFICHTKSESHNTLIINNLCLNPFRNEICFIRFFVPIAGISRPIFGIQSTSRPFLQRGRMEGWKIGRLEDWKIGRLEDWKPAMSDSKL